MAHVASRIEQYLDQRQVNYEVLIHPPVSSLMQAAQSLAIPEDHIIRAVVLKADDQFTIAVLPLGRMLDFSALTQVTGRKFEPVPVAMVTDIFPDCEAGMVPPLGSLYQLDTYCDSSVQQMQQVVFEAGSRRAFIRVKGRDFAALIDRNCFLAMSRAQHELGDIRLDEQSSSLRDFVPVHDIKHSISQLYSLPPAPPLLQRLQDYTLTATRDKTQLIELLMNAAPLSAQLQRMAMPPFAFSDIECSVGSLDEAIDVLGVDLCVALAQGLLVWDTLTVPADGPLGKTSLERQARISAQIAYRLIRCCRGIVDIDAATSAQMALMHKVGYLVLAQLFAPEYFLFNRIVQANPDIPMSVIEKNLLAYGQAQTLMQMGHVEVGAWFLHYWGFPDVLQQVSEHHQDAEYDGPYQHYVHLLILVDHLLQDSGRGDAGNKQLPQKSLSLLGLNEKSLDDFKRNVLHPVLVQQ